MTISHQIRHIRELNSWKTRFHQRKHHVDRICASDCGPHLLKNLTLIFSVSVSELNLDNISQVYCPLYHTIIHVWYRRNTPDIKHRVVIKWWLLIDPRISRGKRRDSSTPKYGRVRMEYHWSTDGVRRSTRGVQWSITEYSGVRVEYQWSTAEYWWSTAEYEWSTAEYKWSTNGVRRSTAEYERSTSGVRVEYKHCTNEA
jgi:hypothetical protein